MNHSLNLNGILMDLSYPKVMGILNVTPDSFYDGGKYSTLDSAMKQAEKMIKEGADIIDIGGCSTRPGAEIIKEKDELKRVLPILKKIAIEFPEIPISIDTFRASVARESIEVGASMINDISAGNLDPEMFQVAADKQVPYVLMHMKGNPQNMQVKPEYENVTLEVVSFLSEKIAELKSLGLNDIIVDPGFGFGKSNFHNYQMLRELDQLQLLNLPVLVGFSMKSMVYKTLGIEKKESLNGTSSLNMLALEKGSKLLRVHDVKAAKEVCQLFENIYPLD